MSTSALLRDRILALLAATAAATGTLVVSCAASSGGADGGTSDSGEAGVADAGDAGLCLPTRYERLCLTHAALIARSRVGCPPGPGSADASPTISEADFTENGCLPRSKVPALPDPALTGPVVEGDTCCYEFCSTGLVCGRPLLVDGRARLASLSSGAEWAIEDPVSHGDAPSAHALAIASAWREDARMEHASIASFARFTLELLAFGAPPGLVADAQRAGADEVRHAELCFALATKWDGRVLGPGPLSLHGMTLAATLDDAVVSAVREGCVGETLAALVCAEQRAVASDPAARRALEEVAADEARHAELAWRFVAWAIGRGGDRVRGAAREAFVAALAPTPAAPWREEAHARVEAWHGAGRLLPAEVRAVMEDGKRSVVRPCAEALVGAITGVG